MCHNCVIKPYQFQDRSPYLEGFALQSDYISLTKSCSRTGFPLATTATSEPTTTSTPQPEPTCTGNPIIGLVCNRLCKSVGDTVCFQPPGDNSYVSSTTNTPAPTPEPTATPAPSDIADGTTERCSEFYDVVAGDYCNKLLVKFSISLEDFLFLNQGVNGNCTNLLADISYSVAPVGPINMYPGHLEYTPPSTTVPEQAFTDLPKATYTLPAITGLPVDLPLAKDTRKECFIFANGPDLQIDSMGWFESSTSQILASAWDISLAELQNWQVPQPLLFNVILGRELELTQLVAQESFFEHVLE